MASQQQGDLDRNERIQILKSHFESKGYRTHSGLGFGVELVLYADDPDRVHSDFCVHLVQQDDVLDFRTLQTLVRSMPDLHKTLILARIVQDKDTKEYTVQEMALTTEHAPFRHRTVTKVGEQRKRQHEDSATNNGEDDGRSATAE